MSRLRNSLFVLRRSLREDLRTRLFYLRERLVHPRSAQWKTGSTDQANRFAKCSAQALLGLQRPIAVSPPDLQASAQGNPCTFRSSQASLLSGSTANRRDFRDSASSAPGAPRSICHPASPTPRKINSQLLVSRVAGMDPPAAGRCEPTIRRSPRRGPSARASY